MKNNTGLIWITDNDDRRKMFLKYAMQFGETFPDQAAVLAAIDDEGRILGFSAVLLNEVISDILIFHVVPEEREKGIEHLMLREIEEVIKEMGIGILRYIMPCDEEMMIFFADEGYDIMEGGREYAVKYGSLSYSEVYRKNIEEEEAKNAVSISECDPGARKILKDFFISNSVGTMDFFNPLLSSVVILDSEVKGLLLCETKPKGIIVYYMFAAPEHPEYLMDCLRVLDNTLSGYKSEDPELMLSFATGNDMEVSLLHHITGNIIPVEEFVRESIAVKTLKAM